MNDNLLLNEQGIIEIYFSVLVFVGKQIKSLPSRVKLLGILKKKTLICTC